MASATVRYGLVNAEGRVFPLGPGRTTIGRGAGNKLVIPDQYLSRAHAAVDFDGQRCTLTDLGSTHGTTLNGQRLQPNQPYPLGPGAQIVLAGRAPLALRLVPPPAGADQGPVPPVPPPGQAARRTSPFILALALVACLLVAALAVLTYLYFDSLDETTATPSPLPPPADLGTSNLYVEYILDASGSMNESLPDGTVKLAVAQKLLTQRLQAFRPETHIGLRAYGHRVHYEQTEESCQDIELIAPVEVGQLPVIVTWLQNFQAQGMTPLAQSIREALNDFAYDPARINTIVMLSDGIETCEGDPCGLVRELKVEGVNFTIHVIGLDVDEPTRQQLKCIADAGEGTYHDARSEEELDAALEAIQGEIVEKEVVAPPGVDTPTPTPTPSALPPAGTPVPPTLPPATVPPATLPPATHTPLPPTVTFTPLPPSTTPTNTPLTPTPTATVAPSHTATDTPTVHPTEPPLSIAYFSDRDTPGYGEIYLMNPDGSGQTRLTSNLQVPEIQPGTGPGIISFDWSPASKQFLFSHGSGVGLYTIGADGGQKTQLASRVAYFSISPSGQRIAVQTIEERPPQIGTMNIDGSGYAQLTNEPDYQLGHPTWSPDGRRIAYLRSDAYWVIGAQGGDPSILIPPGLVPSIYDCSWSSQSRYLVCSTLEQKPALYLVDLETNSASKLLDEGGWFPRWSPDGSQIAFERDHQVWVVKADGSGLRQLTTEGLNGFPIWVARR